ncbi:MAG: hypothetical protein ACK559_30220, partial [bacterium]
KEALGHDQGFRGCVQRQICCVVLEALVGGAEEVGGARGARSCHVGAAAADGSAGVRKLAAAHMQHAAFEGGAAKVDGAGRV